MTVVFWGLVLGLFATAARLGRRWNMIPIVSQLLLATFGLPLLMGLWVEPHWQLSGVQLVAPVWLKTLYGLSFALVLGHILSDVIDVRMDRQSVKVALPSFCVPFVCGVATSVYLLPPQGWISSVAIGLVFAITAIPVLYLYLHHIGYPVQATRRLVQTAILIDLTCWSVFGLAQGSLHLSGLALPLLGACTPLILSLLGVRRPEVYGLLFFALLMAAEHFKLNALILGIGYLLCMNLLKQPFALPLPDSWFKALQHYLAVPLILTFGIVQIDLHNAVGDVGWTILLALIVLPIGSKLVGNWIGIRWAAPSFVGAVRWKETVLLNIRGLSEIIFLNLLFQQRLISPAIYFALMAMSLVATLLPAVMGMNRTPSAQAAEHLKRNTCANN